MPDDILHNPKLSDVQEGDGLEGFYVVRESSLQTAVNGKNYIRMVLADASASVPANVWDANRELYLLCPSSSIIKVQGVTESYRGKTQIRINRFRPAHNSEVDIDSFLPKTGKDMDAMRNSVFDLIGSIRDNDYRALGEAFFQDADIMKKFARSPAAKEVHHAYIGGLMEHTLSMARIAEEYARDARLNRDLLLLGVLLHDIGKIEELSAGLCIEYTDKGKLLGHLFLGAAMVAEKAAGLANFPREKVSLVQHLILSHHGRYEYGSPVLPKTPEAFALHHIDNLDAKVVTANRLLDAIQDPESHWTDFARVMDTALYRASDRPQAMETDTNQ